MAIVDRARRDIASAIVRGVVEGAIALRTPTMAATDRSKLAAQVARLPAQDESILRIVLAQPLHLLPFTDMSRSKSSDAKSWDAYLQQAILAAASATRTKDGPALWGDVNASDFAHPLAQALPLIASKLRLPSHPQSGHWSAVRVATPRFGASDRLVVTPGREERALLSVPAGQSADPDSPHHRDLHPSWRDGIALPLRPGAPVRTIRCTAREDG